MRVEIDNDLMILHDCFADEIISSAKYPASQFIAMEIELNPVHCTRPAGIEFNEDFFIAFVCNKA